MKVQFDENFFLEFIKLAFNNESDINSFNRHLAFALIVFWFAFTIYVLNIFIIRVKGKDYLKLNIYDGKSLCFWIFGAFGISFILTMTNVINITIQSALVIAFTWDKLFSEISNTGQNFPYNPNNPT